MAKISKDQIEALAQRGGFLPAEGESCFHALDGRDAARFLESRGYQIAQHRDTGRNGLAVTKCGLHLSSNGYAKRPTNDFDARVIESLADLHALSLLPAGEAFFCADDIAGGLIEEASDEAYQRMVPKVLQALRRLRHRGWIEAKAERATQTAGGRGTVQPWYRLALDRKRS